MEWFTGAAIMAVLAGVAWWLGRRTAEIDDDLADHGRHLERQLPHGTNANDVMRPGH